MTTDVDQLYDDQVTYPWCDAGWLAYNPHHALHEDLPKIFSFVASYGRDCVRGDCEITYAAVALAEDGTRLNVDVSASPYLARQLCDGSDLTLALHKLCIKHYPNGFRFEYVPVEQVKWHDEVIAAEAKFRQLVPNNVTSKGVSSNG